MSLHVHAGNSASFNPQHVQAAVASIVGRMGCTRCGLVATLPVEYQADPSPASGGQGVVC
ncbi:MAG TPA: hypothetical protein VF798_03835 [Burkholderiaceae bacterium]